MTVPKNDTSTEAAFLDSGFFVMRSPLLPFDDLLNWANLPPHLVGDSERNFAAEEWWMKASCSLRDRLRQLVDRPEIRSALFVASPSLEASIDTWKRDPSSKKGIQTERSLVRYLSRMATRPTPFGLFSGCSVGRIEPDGSGPEYTFDLEAQGTYRLRAMLNYGCLFDLCGALNQVPAISATVRYVPNTSLHKTATVWHYLETQRVDFTSKHILVKLSATEILDTLIELAAHNGATREELVDCILSHQADGSITQNEANAYVEDLVRSQVLVSNLAPAVTGDKPVELLIDTVKPLSSTHAAQLEDINRHITHLNAKGLLAAPNDYRVIVNNVALLTQNDPQDDVFKVEMFKPVSDAVISGSIIEDTLRSLSLLCLIGSAPLKGHLMMARFRDKFRDRYGPAYVPLAEALSEEVGIGFLRDLEGSELRSPFHGAFHSVMVKKVVEASKCGSQEIQISAEEFSQEQAVRRCGLPDSFSAVITLVRDPGSQAASILLRSAVGPPGITTLARFGGIDHQLDQHIQKHIEQEEALAPDSVFAEIVYLPEGQIGNILARPVIRNYEIPYLGRSGVTPGRQIQISDLLVTVTNDDSIVLYSKSLDKRIIPRLSSAHTFSKPQWAPLYRFLCLTQYEPWRVVPVFDWEGLSSLPFLPRVRAGRVIVQLARWTMDATEIAELSQNKDRADAFHAVQSLRDRRGLPRWVSLVEGDNTLPVDLDNPLSVDAFVHLLRRAKQGVLEELYPHRDGLTVNGPEGKYQHELVIPFVRKVALDDRPERRAGLLRRLQLAHEVPRGTPSRSLSPGSEWLYVKLYASPTTVDDLLTGQIADVTDSAFKKSLIDRWFFVRYADPEFHLRVRFHGHPKWLRCELLSILHNELVDMLNSGRLRKIELATYQREIERYGGLRALEMSEAVFSADSDAAVHVLRAVQDEFGGDLRVEAALLSADRLLADFGLCSSERLQVITGLQKELRPSLATDHTLKDQMLKESKRIDNRLLNHIEEPPARLGTVDVGFKRRSLNITPIVLQLKALATNSPVIDPVNIVSQYVHMTINRIVREKHAEHEKQIYEWLVTLYRSQIARERVTKPPEPTAENSPGEAEGFGIDLRRKTR